MLIGRNFKFFGAYLVVTARYCSLPGGYCPFLVVTVRYRPVSMNGKKIFSADFILLEIRGFTVAQIFFSSLTSFKYNFL